MAVPFPKAAAPSLTLRLGQRRRGRVEEGGFATLELVILFPVMFAFALLIVGFGRVERGRDLVGQASANAARAASLASTPGQAQTAARQEAADDLAGAGVSCKTMSATVNTDDFHAGGQVSVTVTCVTSLSGLTVVGLPGSKTLTATSVSPLDAYRQYGGGS